MAQILCFQNLNPDPDPPNSQVFVQYNLKEYPKFHRVIPIKGWVRIRVLSPDPLFFETWTSESGSGSTRFSGLCSVQFERIFTNLYLLKVMSGSTNWVRILDLDPDPDTPNSQVFVQYNLKEYQNFHRVIP